MFPTYSNSKLALTTGVAKLAEYVNPDGVIVNSVNPGACAGTEFGRGLTGFVNTVIFPALMRLMGRTVATGASCYIDGAVVQEGEPRQLLQRLGHKAVSVARQDAEFWRRGYAKPDSQIPRRIIHRTGREHETEIMGRDPGRAQCRRSRARAVRTKDSILKVTTYQRCLSTYVAPYHRRTLIYLHGSSVRHPGSTIVKHSKTGAISISSCVDSPLLLCDRRTCIIRISSAMNGWSVGYGECLGPHARMSAASWPMAGGISSRANAEGHCR